MNKRLINCITVLTVSALTLCLVPADAYSAKKPSLNSKKISLHPGESFKLKIKNKKKKATVRWSVSNKKIVKIILLF